MRAILWMRGAALGLVGVLSLAAVAPAAAAPDPVAGARGVHDEGRHPGWGRGPGGERAGRRQRVRPLARMLRHRDALGLTAGQVQKLEQLRADFRRDAIRRGAELRVAELELRDLARADQADLAAVEAKLREIESRRTELRLAAIRTVEAGKAELTPDQRARLRTLVDERRLRGRSGAPGAGPLGPAGDEADAA